MTTHIIPLPAKVVAPRPSRESPGWNRKMQQEFYRHPFVLTTTSQNERWPLEQLHDFCWKACAIYDLVKLSVPARAMLFNYVWSRWFIKGETACEYGNNFAKYIGCWEPTSPKTIPAIMKAHQAICAQVSHRTEVLDEKDSNTKHHCHANVDYHAGYKLQPAFQDIIMIIDEEPLLEREGTWANWEGQSILLVRAGYPYDSGLGPVAFHPVDSGSQLEGDENVRNISFGKAMDIVLGLQRREDASNKIGTDIGTARAAI